MTNAPDDPVFTHLDEGGRPAMVDVSDRPVTDRTAVARGCIRMRPETLEAILRGEVRKGSVLRTAEIAGIMGAKRTGELIPLCHLLPALSARVEVSADPSLPGLRVEVVARIAGATGVEMEALTGAAVALLTIYDMAKALDPAMQIEDLHLVRKEGGRSGPWEAPGRSPAGPAGNLARSATGS